MSARTIPMRQDSDPHEIAPPARVSGSINRANGLKRAVTRLPDDLPRAGPVDPVLLTGKPSDDASPESYALSHDLMVGAASNRDYRLTTRACRMMGVEIGMEIQAASSRGAAQDRAMAFGAYRAAGWHRSWASIGGRSSGSWRAITSSTARCPGSSDISRWPRGCRRRIGGRVGESLWGSPSWARKSKTGSGRPAAPPPSTAAARSSPGGTFGPRLEPDDPQSSRRKDTVCNATRRARRGLPREGDISHMTGVDIREIADRRNATPREGLEWRTPAEDFA